jgi:hypothetical protein
MPVKLQDAAAVVGLLSAERLARLIELTGSELDAIELHQDTLKLGAALMRVAATLEIALRNTVSANLSNYFGVANWLQQPPKEFTWRDPERNKIKQAVDSAKRAEYSKLSQAEKSALDAKAYPNGRTISTSHTKRSKDRRSHLVVTEGKVVAELTLFFWKRLYGPEYAQTLWRTTLKRTFPDKAVTRADVAVQLEHLYQTRNRLAHHEPVLYRRFQEAINAMIFIAQRLNAPKPNPTSPLANLLCDEIAALRASEADLRARLDVYRC